MFNITHINVAKNKKYSTQHKYETTRSSHEAKEATSFLLFRLHPRTQPRLTTPNAFDR